MRSLRIAIEAQGETFSSHRIEQLLPCDQTTLIGRKCEGITLASPLCSRIHAQIIVREDGIFIEDLNSKNGIRINGTKRRGLIEVHLKDQIDIGHHTLTLVSWVGSENQKIELEIPQVSPEADLIVKQGEPWDSTFR